MGEPKADTSYECGVCWYVYDPARGDDEWQIRPGTAFEELPDAWRCPRCDAARDRFLPVRGDAPETMAARVAALEGAFRRADAVMRALPIYNPRLRVEAVGFRPFEDGWIGALVTPWFVSAVAIARTARSDVRHGAPRVVELPSGAYEFSVAEIEPFGTVETCSLASPVLDLRDQDAARALAAVAIGVMLAPPAVDLPPAAHANVVTRRALFGGGAGG